MINQNFFPDDLPTPQELSKHSETYRQNGKSAAESIAVLIKTRDRIGQLIVNKSIASIEENYKKIISPYMEIYIKSCLPEDDIDNKNEKLETSKKIILFMLYKPAYKAPVFDFNQIPIWLIDDFIKYISKNQTVITKQSDLKKLKIIFRNIQKILLFIAMKKITHMINTI